MGAVHIFSNIETQEHGSAFQRDAWRTPSAWNFYESRPKIRHCWKKKKVQRKCGIGYYSNPLSINCTTAFIFRYLGYFCQDLKFEAVSGKSVTAEHLMLVFHLGCICFDDIYEKSVKGKGSHYTVYRETSTPSSQGCAMATICNYDTSKTL